MACCPFQIVTDEVCGSFTLACGTATAEPLYTPVTIVPTGTITVTNISDCSSGVVVTINTTSGPVIFSVPAGNSRSRTLLGIVSVVAACGAGTGEACRGKYCLNLHYGLPTGA